MLTSPLGLLTSGLTGCGSGMPVLLCSWYLESLCPPYKPGLALHLWSERFYSTSLRVESTQH